MNYLSRAPELLHYLPPELISADHETATEMVEACRSMKPDQEVPEYLRRLKDISREQRTQALIRDLQNAHIPNTLKLHAIDLAPDIELDQRMLDYLWSLKEPDYIRAYVAHAVTNVAQGICVPQASTIKPRAPIAALYTGDDLGRNRVVYVAEDMTVVQVIGKMGIMFREGMCIQCQVDLEPTTEINNIGAVRMTIGNPPLSVTEQRPRMLRIAAEHNNQQSTAEALLVRADEYFT